MAVDPPDEPVDVFGEPDDDPELDDPEDPEELEDPDAAAVSDEPDFEGEESEDEDPESEDDDPESEDEDPESEDDDPESDEDDPDPLRLSLRYQPLPLKTMPTDEKTLRRRPVHSGHSVSEGSLNAWTSSKR